MTRTVPVPAAGSAMPDIRLTAADGSTSSLTAEIRNTPTIIHFMRSSTCPVCLAHSRAITAMITAGTLSGHRLMLITPGDADEAQKVASTVKSPQVAIWASGSSHRDVGLGQFLMIQHSGTFLISADGIIRHARTSTVPTQSFSAAEIVAVLAAEGRAGAA